MSDEPQALAAQIDSVTPWWLFAFLAALAVTVAAMVAMTHRVRVSVDELRAQQKVQCEAPQAAAVPEPAPDPVITRTRRSPSKPAATPSPDQLADTSELVESPTPPAPITRQSVDQFRASLRTPQPVQE